MDGFPVGVMAEAPGGNLDGTKVGRDPGISNVQYPRTS